MRTQRREAGSCDKVSQALALLALRLEQSKHRLQRLLDRLQEAGGGGEVKGQGWRAAEGCRLARAARQCLLLPRRRRWAARLR